MSTEESRNRQAFERAMRPVPDVAQYNKCPKCGTRWTPPELKCPTCQDADQPTATATPVYRFSLASWLSIYGRTCLMDFVKETDYATLERELSSAQAALIEAKAEVAESKELYRINIKELRADLSCTLAERDQLRARVEELEKLYAEERAQNPTLVHRLIEDERDQLRARVAELDKQIVDEAVLFNDLRSRITELEQDLREDRHLAKLSDENAVLMKRVAELEESVTTLSGQCTSLFNERETLVADRYNMDWMEMQIVEVRTPLVHGSRGLFCVSPTRGDGEERPSKLRAAIEAAKGQP